MLWERQSADVETSHFTILYIAFNTFLGRAEHDNETQFSIASANAAVALISLPSKASYDGFKFQRRLDSYDGDDTLRQV